MSILRPPRKIVEDENTRQASGGAPYVSPRRGAKSYLRDVFTGQGFRDAGNVVDGSLDAVERAGARGAVKQAGSGDPRYPVSPSDVQVTPREGLLRPAQRRFEDGGLAGPGGVVRAGAQDAGNVAMSAAVNPVVDIAVGRSNNPLRRQGTSQPTPESTPGNPTSGTPSSTMTPEQMRTAWASGQNVVLDGQGNRFAEADDPNATNVIAGAPPRGPLRPRNMRQEWADFYAPGGGREQQLASGARTNQQLSEMQAANRRDVSPRGVRNRDMLARAAEEADKGRASAERIAAAGAQSTQSDFKLQFDETGNPHFFDAKTGAVKDFHEHLRTPFDDDPVVQAYNGRIQTLIQDVAEKGQGWTGGRVREMEKIMAERDKHIAGLQPRQGAGSDLAIGTVQAGWRYKGGNPNDQSSWERASA